MSLDTTGTAPRKRGRLLLISLTAAANLMSARAGSKAA